ncbi:hypothetical protein ACET3Z_028060 [Daucus carota]
MPLDMVIVIMKSVLDDGFVMMLTWHVLIADAVVYRRAHDLLCGVGNAYGNLMELDVLASRGHFLSMVAAPAFPFLFQK